MDSASPDSTGPRTCDLLIRNARLLANPGESDRQDCAYLAVRAGCIAEVGAMEDLPPTLVADRLIDAGGDILIPGLVNCHCHAAMTLFRGLADDLPLLTWLREHIFPAEAARVDAEMVYWCSKLAAAEMLLSGTTTVADGYFHEDAAAQAFCAAGIRAVAAQGVIDFPAPGVPDPHRNIEAAADFLASWQGKNPLLTPALFCHSPYTCAPATLQAAKEESRRAGALFCVHVAETRWELEQCRQQHGLSPVRFLDELGILDARTLCVHAVWLAEEDIGILRKTGAGVVTCPESNMKLASGVARLPAMLEAGVAVGLGTDGCASNNDLDLFREMGSCARLHKVTGLDATLLPAARVFAMATSGGAGVLGLGGQVGRFVPGMRADCLLVDARRPHLAPLYAKDTLVYAGLGSDVRTVIVDGRVVVRDGQLVSFDLAETLREVRRLAARIRAGI
ncbi:amidohydrolase [Thiovibrio sp. JS02]